MRKPWDGHPSPGWRKFLEHHAREIWACDLFTVQTIWLRTLYVFFVIYHGTREVIHARVTAHPTAEWLAQQLAEACDVDREPPRYLIHDRDGCFGAAFNRRVQSLGIVQIRAPVKAPRANAVAERWVRTVRTECLDHRPVFGHQYLQRVIKEYVAYYNGWRPHRNLDQKAHVDAGDGSRQGRLEELLQSRSLVDCTKFIDSRPDQMGGSSFCALQPNFGRQSDSS